MNDDIKNTQKLIEHQRNLITQLADKVSNSPTFEIAEMVGGDLARAKFDLSQLQKELSGAERAQIGTIYKASVAAYNKKLADYSASLKEMERLEKAAIVALQTLNETFDAHYKLSLNLKAISSNLRHEAANLTLDEPPYPKYGNQNADEHVYELIRRARSRGYISQLLSLAFQPVLRGGWIQHGIFE